ncbi:VOC family protein [Gammaproteobacteria bacterium LSUCC0112]|nr:VOC family protein [Gammaproteobacteria bacterium LSUCC0112]
MSSGMVAGVTLDLKKPAIDLGIITRDAAPMLAFYKDFLGLPLESVIPMPSGGTMHRLKVGDTVLKIVQLEKPPAADAVPGGIPAATGMRYFTFHIGNLQQVVTACDQAGYAIVVPVKTIRPGVSIAIVKDPDGNWLELLCAG